MKLNDFLKQVELLKGLNNLELEELTCSIEKKAFSQGEILFRENTPRTNIFIIYSGEVELFKINRNGAGERLTYFSKGDFLGEGSLSSESLHSTSARALGETTVFTIHKDFFLKSSSASFKIFSNITRVMSRRMRNANNRTVDVAAQYESGRRRKEKDLLGELEVPYEVYYGIQTLRGIENFSISGVTLNFFPNLVNALAMVKMAASKANRDLGLLQDSVSDAIISACKEIINGKFHSNFAVDMIQGGAGTSTNMNANEVIANRALEILGFERGDYFHCHPNNHVNLSQSTNDAYPTAVKIAIIKSNNELTETLKELIYSFRKKGEDFSHIIKMGRTQLQDAVPMTLGQSFEAYAVTLEEELIRLNENSNLFLEVNMGGTAIGTGINSDPDYAEKVIFYLQKITGLKIVSAINLVEATQDTGAFVMYSSALKRTALKLSKICNDLRLLSSGPRAGLNEINLPPMQPGSSIMPGKVNPVIPEVVNQIAFKVIGNDLTVTLAAEAGQLELNVMEPVIANSIFESVEMLKNGIFTLNTRCIEGITANEQHCRNLVLNSIGLITALNPVLGYETCNRLAKTALEKDMSVYDLVIKEKLLSREKLDSLLLPENMIGPRKMKKVGKKYST